MKCTGSTGMIYMPNCQVGAGQTLLLKQCVRPALAVAAAGALYGHHDASKPARTPPRCYMRHATIPRMTGC